MIPTAAITKDPSKTCPFYSRKKTRMQSSSNAVISAISLAYQREQQEMRQRCSMLCRDIDIGLDTRKSSEATYK